MTSEYAEKNRNSILKIALNLTAACVISGLIIGIVYFFTKDIAIQKQIELKNLALQSLVAEADQYTRIPDKTDWYTASKNGQVIAYIVPTESKGYGGPIKMLVAIDKNNKIIKYTILESKETPGLGDKASKPLFADQFVGKSVNNLQVTKNQSDKESIQAISGATISSKAVTLAVKNAMDEVANFAKGVN
ncbi:RnfABCDGE type electron transport complex subunit G [Desulfitobacterium metallireducens]|uniref:Ion-translocating oxidoreductase complex subunit G n=1 Tax=Desulfitobacterium metallireducens DSM 15288 TaxID=871968 RepID=W0EDU8_9FIRM|nr:RnfABCDGE type electron transport complex subunit G [Desulfitobacterium metallireducens]AHF07236.1 protein RnfG [Desulfitobacterium metallireducens DSM 15288]